MTLRARRASIGTMRAKPVTHVALNGVEIPPLFTHALLANDLTAVAFSHASASCAALSAAWHAGADVTKSAGHRFRIRLRFARSLACLLDATRGLVQGGERAFGRLSASGTVGEGGKGVWKVGRLCGWEGDRRCYGNGVGVCREGHVGVRVVWHVRGR